MAETLITVPGTDPEVFTEDQMYRMIILEIWEKTEGLGIIWSELSPGNYEASFLLGGTTYMIRIGKVSRVYVLDVWKNSVLWFTRNSGIDFDVEQLYLEISLKVKWVPPQLPDFPRCRTPVVYLEIMHGGIKVDGGTRVPENFKETMYGGLVIGGLPEWAYDFPCRCERTDVALLMDITGSMSSAIEVMRGAFVEIRKAFGSPDCRWAVCSYRDFEDTGYEAGYVIHQSFTSDYDLIETALSLLHAGGGGDGEEQNYAALKGIADNWIAGLRGTDDVSTQRAIIWCGDYPGWNGNAKELNYPTHAEVVATLQREHIYLMALNVFGPGSGIDDMAPMDSVDNQATRLVTEVGGRIMHNVTFVDLEVLLEDVCAFLIDVAESTMQEEMHNGVQVGGTAGQIQAHAPARGGGITVEGVVEMARYNETMQGGVVLDGFPPDDYIDN